MLPKHKEKHKCEEIGEFKNMDYLDFRITILKNGTAYLQKRHGESIGYPIRFCPYCGKKVWNYKYYSKRF